VGHLGDDGDAARCVPDISDVQVIVSTEWMGRSPDIIEDQITYPIVTALLSAPRVRTVRGFTDFGISYVYVIFEDGTDIYWARSRVVEYLQGFARACRKAAIRRSARRDRRRLGLQYAWSTTRAAQPRRAARRAGLVPALRAGIGRGVAEVASIGGFVKQYQVNLDPNKLAAYDKSVKDVVQAIRASNNEVEGGCSSSRAASTWCADAAT
jgi:Cu(I)/Ag(I) efflux system membrane protein CusA/SilA